MPLAAVLQLVDGAAAVRQKCRWVYGLYFPLLSDIWQKLSSRILYNFLPEILCNFILYLSIATNWNWELMKTERERVKAASHCFSWRSNPWWVHTNDGIMTALTRHIDLSCAVILPSMCYCGMFSAISISYICSCLIWGGISDAETCL